MMKLRAVLFSGALICALASAAFAQTGDDSNKTIKLATALNSYAAYTAAAPASTNPPTYISLRGGALVSPTGAGLVGVDFSFPTIGIAGTGWHGRLDVDALIKNSTIVPVTADLLYFSTGGAGGHNVYFGGGLGAVFGNGRTEFDPKLVLGAEFAPKVGGEINIHFPTNFDTLVTLLVRIHL